MREKGAEWRVGYGRTRKGSERYGDIAIVTIRLPRRPTSASRSRQGCGWRVITVVICDDRPILWWRTWVTPLVK